MWVRFVLPLASIFTSSSPLLAHEGASKEGIRSSRSKDDPRWFEASVTIAASAERIWTTLSRIEDWSRTFSDIKAVEVKSKKDSDIMASVHSKALGHPHDWAIEMVPKSGLSFVMDGSGVKLEGIFALTAEPGDATKTRVTLRMLAESSGFVGAFIPESSVREKQEHMALDYLADLRRTAEK